MVKENEQLKHELATLSVAWRDDIKNSSHDYHEPFSMNPNKKGFLRLGLLDRIVADETRNIVIRLDAADTLSVAVKELLYAYYHHSITRVQDRIEPLKQAEKYYHSTRW